MPHKFTYNFPATLFAGKNTIGQQLDHLLSEIDEIEQLGPVLDAAEGDLDAVAGLPRLLHLEAMDALHSLETLFRILARQHGDDYVDQLKAETYDKNNSADRDYYERAAR